MKLTYEPLAQRGDGLIVRLSGNLEINGANQLWEDVSTRADEQTRNFVFDFSDVAIVTSAGIGTLVRLLVRLRGYGGTVAIFGCSDKIKEVFSIVMLRDILHVCEGEHEALALLT
jgi:anti-anti-sigma factor